MRLSVGLALTVPLMSLPASGAVFDLVSKSPGGLANAGVWVDVSKGYVELHVASEYHDSQDVAEARAALLHRPQGPGMSSLQWLGGPCAGEVDIG
jgi:hypothetical protein